MAKSTFNPKPEEAAKAFVIVLRKNYPGEGTLASVSEMLMHLYPTMTVEWAHDLALTAATETD